MLYGFSLSLLYLTFFAFYQADSRRTMFDALKGPSSARVSLRSIGWLMALLALFACAFVSGWERGAPIWIGLFSLAGGFGLLISALAPEAFRASGFAAACAVMGFGLLSLPSVL